MTIKIVVPVSGGKDSQACLKLALQQYGTSEILGLFNDTGFEHPKTYLHIEKMYSLYGVNIVTRKRGNVLEKCKKYGRFPGGRIRFCTDELKIQPSIRFYEGLALLQDEGFEVWYGMRLAESTERKERYSGKVSDEVYSPNEFMKKYPKRLTKLGVKIRLPILEWSKYEVLDFLDGEENPLYKDGFDRVGCFPCLASGDKHKEKAFTYDAFGVSQYNKVKAIGEELGKTIWTSKKGKKKFCMDSPGCSLCSY